MEIILITFSKNVEMNEWVGPWVATSLCAASMRLLQAGSRLALAGFGAQISNLLHISSNMTEAGHFWSTRRFADLSGSLDALFYYHAQGKTSKIRKTSARTLEHMWSDLPFFSLSRKFSQPATAAGKVGNTVACCNNRRRRCLALCSFALSLCLSAQRAVPWSLAAGWKKKKLGFRARVDEK